MKNLGKKLKTAFLIGLIFYSLSEEKINEIKYGKEYTGAKQSLDSSFISNLYFIKRDYFVRADGVKIGSPEFQELKRDYQEKEAILTQDWYDKSELLKSSKNK
jgi:hypothetical protein